MILYFKVITFDVDNDGSNGVVNWTLLGIIDEPRSSIEIL